MSGMHPGFDLDLHVHYGFVWLTSSDVFPDDLIGARAGQRNGICGAAYPGVLSLLTGLHTGTVPFRVELWDREPPLDDSWEDVAEVDFEPQDTELGLSTFDSGETIVLPSMGNYRVRYCAVGTDDAHEQDTRLEGDEITDRYLLALWPAAPAPERVIRQTSAQAAYWAGVAAETPAPVPPTAAELASADAAAEEAERQQQEQLHALLTRRAWRGIEPTVAMLRMGPVLAGIARYDPALAELIATSAAPTHHRLALWAAQQACERAVDTDLDWRPALEALERRAPLPAPFDDDRRLFDTVYGSDRSMSVTVERRDPSASAPGHTAIDPPAAAAAAVRAAAEPDPAIAAVGALEQAAAGTPDPGAFYTRARQMFGASD